MELVSKYGDFIVIALAAVCILLFLLIIVILLKLRSLRKAYLGMFNGTGEINIEQAIVEMGHSIRSVQDQQKGLETSIQRIMKDLQHQKSNAAIIRYNAFGEAGNDLSFSIAIIDDFGDGLVLTGIHNRENTQIYAKPLEQGESKYKLSPEEEQAVNQALPQRK